MMGRLLSLLWTGLNCHLCDLSHSCRSGQCVSRVTPRYRAVSTHSIGSPKSCSGLGLAFVSGLNEESHSALRDVDGYIPARRAEHRKIDKWYWYIERKGQERSSDWNSRRRRVLSWLAVHFEHGCIRFSRLVSVLQTTRHNVPQDGNFHNHCLENIKSWRISNWRNNV